MGADIFPLWVHGIPSSYSNPPRDAAWRAALAMTLPFAPAIMGSQGIKADFVLLPADWSRKGNDLDNLCELLFSVLINARRWIGGRRPNLRWYRVSKKPGEPSGCLVDVVESMAPTFEPIGSLRILDDVYTGELPRNVRDPMLARWVESRSGLAAPRHAYSVLLQFESNTLNIGDIATGYVKAVVDSLYPVLCGNPKEPRDWQITILQVERGISSLPSNGLRTCLWAS